MLRSTAIETETEVRRIELAQIHDIAESIKYECDKMAILGYDLASSFVLNDEVVLIFTLNAQLHSG